MAQQWPQQQGGNGYDGGQDPWGEGGGPDYGQGYQGYGGPSSEDPDQDPGFGARGGGTPGAYNLFMQPGSMGGSGFDPVRYVGRGSLKPEEYLPMSRFTDQELSRLVRINAMLNLVNFGTMDLPETIWYFINGRIAVDGQGRDDVVDMVIGYRKRQEDRRRQSGMGGSGRTWGGGGGGRGSYPNTMSGGGRNRALGGNEWQG